MAKLYDFTVTVYDASERQIREIRAAIEQNLSAVQDVSYMTSEKTEVNKNA